MTHAELLLAPAEERLRCVAAGSISLQDLAACRDERIRELDPVYRAFADWRPLSAGCSAPIAVAYKDLIDIEGWATRCGSRTGFRYYPERSAEVVSLLDRTTATAGKTETTEFGIGNWIPCVNPIFPAFSPGGASTGSAVAVAAGFCDLSIGTDTAGSVRCPAAYCGVVGMRLTPDDGFLDGVVRVSPRMDSVGIIARSAADLAYLWRHDALVAVRRRVVRTSRRVLHSPLRVGIVTNWRDTPVDARLLAPWDAFVDRLGSAVASLSEVTATWWRFREAAWTLLLREVADVHRELARRFEIEYSESLAAILQLGESISKSQYEAACLDQQRAVAEMERTFAAEAVDVLVLPFDSVLPRHVSTPFPRVVVPDEDSGRSGDTLGFAAIAGFARIPALALAIGRAANGAPVGAQVFAPQRAEDVLVDAAQVIEAAAASPAPSGTAPVLEGASP